ncbi:MAG: hypothetical protein II926_06300 [Bacteroidales bacterium]|nr:hypothetical protein [Bacteroidales bacterium]
MKKLLLVLFTHIVATQALFAQLEIETTVPTGFDEAINVGVGTGYFETIVKNKSGVETITGIKVTPLVGLDGLEILANATYEYNGTVYSASVTGDLIQTDGSVRLMAGEQIKFLYEKRAKCSIVPQASSGYSMQVIDDITVLGTNYSEQTNSYPVLFPGLSVIVPESPYNNVDVEYHEEFTDTVSIRNEANAGSVSHLVLQMERAKNILAVYNVDVTFNGQRLSFPFSTSQDVRIELNSSDLEQLGFPNGIMPSNSQFQMIVSGRVEKYAATTQVRYSVDYKTFGISCGRLKNAEGVKYFQQAYPNPQLSITSHILSKGNFCGEKLIVEYLIESINIQNPSNHLLDLYLNAVYSNGYSIDAVYCNDILLSTSASLSYYLLGVGNIDNNNITADYKGDRPIKLKIIATPKYYTTGFACKFFVRIEGKKINGDSFMAFPDSWEESQKRSSSYVTGDATIDDVIKPIGTYTYDYNVLMNTSGKETMNYYLSVKKPDGELEPISGIVDNDIITYKGTCSATITACEDPSPKFQVVLLTENCEEKPVIITEARPDVLQRCHTGGGSGACYAGDVTEASFNREEINTCDDVMLQAKGTVSYRCSSECPRYKSVAVSVEEKSKQLPIEMKETFLENVSSTNYFDYREGTIAYEFPIQMGCPDKDTIITKELNFQGKLFVNGHINAERIDANIQVRYMLIGENDSIYDGTLTWGDMLTVYDPKPTFGITVPLTYCNPGEVIAKMGKGAPTGNPARIQITEVTLPAQPDFYYEPNGIYATEMPYTIGNLQWEVIQGQNESMPTYGLRPKCAEDAKTNSRKEGSLTYVDFYGTSCAEEKTVPVFGIPNVPYEMPQIILHPTERQQSVESTTTWTLLVENTGHSTARHVMLRLTPNEENSMTIKIEKVRINGQVCYDIRRRGGSVYVPMPSNFLKSSQKVVTVTASYKDCIEYGISAIDVESAWSCEELTENNFDDFNCGGTAVLELENMVAVLNVIETYPKKYFNLCEDIPIHLDISNIGRADLSQMGFWFEALSNTYNISNDALIWNYDGRTNVITGISSVLVSNSILSQNVLTSSQEVLKSSYSMNLDFNIQTACTEDQLGIDKVSFVIRGYSNCGEIQERKFGFSPKLKGFEALDSISISGRQISEFEKPQDTASFIVCIQNNSSRLVDSAFISVLIPVGYEIVGYTPLQDGTVSMMTESIYNDTLILYQWELTKHSNIQANDSVAVKFDITSNLDCPPSGKLSYYGTLKRYMFDCTGDSCLTSRSTNPIYVDLNPKFSLFSAEMIGNSSTCVGTNTNYQIQGQGIQSIQWNCQFPYIENGNEISITYENTGEYTIQALVTGQCESKTVQTKTEVLSIPDISIDESKNVTWRKWEEEGVTCIDSSLIIENWTISLIDTCGTYTLTYTERNQCGQSSQDMDLTIYRCCEIEPIVIPDTVFIQWYDEWNEDLAQHIDCQPKDGVFELIEGESHNMCGEYLFRYTVSQCDTVYSDSVVIIVENCCGENPMGDIVITDRQGVTTFDVEVLRYYLKHPESLVKKTDEYESYYLQMEDCGGKIKKVDLIRCFPQWIDINGDGSVDEKDVNELIKLVH